MRKTVLAGIAFLTLSLTLTACGSSDDMMNDSKPVSMSSMSMSSDEMMPAARMGQFAGLNEKNVAGAAEITNDQIRLTGFSSDEGPDLHLYLANGTDEAAVGAGMEIDKVAFDKSSQMFTLDGIDASKYTHVVVHCDKAKVTFGAAMLTP